MKYKFIKFKVLSPDVWGHGSDEHDDFDCDGECEGYTVNNRFNAGEIEIFSVLKTYNKGTQHEFSDYDFEDRHVVGALKRSDYLHLNIPEDRINVDGDDQFLCIDDAETGEPLYQLEKI